MRTHPRTAANRPRRGFSLIELIVAIAIMAMLAGAAVPITSKVLTSKARGATRTELGHLSEASGEFFRDLRRLPTDISELLVSTGDAAWSGPYLPGVVTDQLTGLTGYQVDAWSRVYQVAVAGNVMTITSAGEDGIPGTARDLEIQLDVTPIRREETLRQLAILNQAVILYNAQYQSTSPLPASWPSALAALVSRGFLPSAAGYDVDWWGDAFVEDPAGVSPVVRVRSVNVSSGS